MIHTKADSDDSGTQFDFQNTLNSGQIESLADAVNPVKPSESLKNRIFQSISVDTSFQAFIPRLQKLLKLPQEQIQKTLKHLNTYPGDNWQSLGLKGIFVHHFAGGDEHKKADCGLLVMNPGSHFPAHKHLGDELSLVLQGEIMENAKQLKTAGDWIIHTPETTHSFEVVGEKPAIVMVVLYEGFEFV